VISCARATRGLRRPSLDAHSGRPTSPLSFEEDQQALKEYWGPISRFCSRRVAWGVFNCAR
jgi:hypothetical protein